MKKNGFTLVEIIGVIVILSIIMIIVIPNVTNSSTSAKLKIYNTKMESIKKGAILYAQDNYKILVDRAAASESGCYIEHSEGIDYSVCEIRIGDLVGQYIVADREGDEALSQGYMEDPRNKKRSLDDDKVIVKINPKDRSIIAEAEGDK